MIAGRIVLLRRLLFAACTLTLLVGVIASTPRRIYDERFHLERADAIARGTPLGEVFTGRSASAVGPVFPLLHAVAQRVLGDDVRGARLVSLACMLACAALVAWVLRRAGDAPDAAVLLMCSSPFVVSAALALTEMPALVLTFGAFAVAWSARGRAGTTRGRLALAAVLMGLAVLTRQSLLVLVPALALAWIATRGFSALDLALLLVPSLAAVLLLLSWWGGLVPPGQERLVAAGGFSVQHALRATAYCAIIGAMMQPAAAATWPVAVLGGAGIVLNLLGGWWTFPVLASAFPDGALWTDEFRRVFWGGVFGLSCGYFATVARAAWTRRDPVAAVSLLAVALIAASCGAVTSQISSRYVVVATPFLVIPSRGRTSPSGELGGVAGAVLGFVLALGSLRAYGLWS